jgi:hypothetical protein
LPVATLIAGLQVVTWFSAGGYLIYKHLFSWRVPLEGVYATILGALWFWLQAAPVHSLLAGISLAAMFISAYILWRTLQHEDGRECASINTKQRLRALLLLLAFMWAWGSLRYFVYVASTLPPVSEVERVFPDDA